MISIVIPVYNEEKILRQNILRLSAWLKEKALQFEILVVDNGSTDHTPSIMQEMTADISELQFFQISKRSVGRAFAEGVRRADSDKIISMDADLSVDLEFILQADRLLENATMVVGSKTLGLQSRSLFRILGSQMYLLVTQLLFKMTITDFSMGAKAYRRQKILPILDEIDEWTAYVFEICLWLTFHKQPILQIGVSCDDRRKSRFNIWHEGFYRYWNLLTVWREFQNPQSWFRRISVP